MPHAQRRARGVYELDFRSCNGEPIMVAVDHRGYAVAWMIVPNAAAVPAVTESLWATLDTVDPEARQIRIV